jgi:hypothetical protein
MASSETSAESVVADMMQKILEQLKDRPREEITADKVVDAMVLAVGKSDALDEKGLELFKQVVKQMLAGETRSSSPKNGRRNSSGGMLMPVSV